LGVAVRRVRAIRAWPAAFGWSPSEASRLVMSELFSNGA
jgi:hypothetical protein